MSGPVVAVVGPTAAGKSALGMALARAVGGHVVNADSMQLYRGMDIGTAKLTQSERAGVPHHLLDIWAVTRTASVAEYQRLARTTIDDILGQGRVPLLVGGSGLYVRAALEEFEFPGTDARLRERLEAELARRGPAPLHARLRSVDPAAAARILPSNGRRIVRALEVIELTGGPFTARLPEPRPVYAAVQIGLDLDPSGLDERIASRVDRMWAAGLVDEVRELAKQGLREGRTASRALGYQQVLRFLDGEYTEEEAYAETVRATRRFIRRQRSWFGRDPRIHWLDAARPDLVQAALQAVRAAPDVAADSPDGVPDVVEGGPGQHPGRWSWAPRTGSRTPRRGRGRRGPGIMAPMSRGPGALAPVSGVAAAGEPDRLTFAKGHGTGNDFVILPDPDGQLPLTPRLVAAICDRRRGIGADGVLRVVRTAKHPDAAGYAGEAEWFMDYWNADGSSAEMCGNGVRVFTRYLLDAGLAGPDPAGIPLATRAGVVRAVVGDREISAGLAPPRAGAASAAFVAGETFPGTTVDCGNPHLVCDGLSARRLSTLDLSRAPEYDAGVFPAGVNVEFVTRVADLHVRMRVYERGSGETLSCGSGACAVAAVVLRQAGLETGTVTVDVPGGRLTVTLDGGTCWLAGPAIIVATGLFALITE